MSNKPIFALATPYAMGAIHVIRVSGFNIFKILNRICSKPIVKKGFCIERNRIVNKKEKRIIDDVLLMKYVAPKSYTGEDLIEINCHGSIHIVNEIAAILQAIGIQPATPGEFTKRAFLNQKLDLNQSAAVDLLVKTPNRYVRDFAVNTLLNSEKKEIDKLQNKLFKLIAKFEIAIDYPEYEEAEINFALLRKEILEIQKNLQNIYNDSNKVLATNKGIKIAIIGKPNVGKSTLLNALLKKDRAIVSNVAGTTRDVIEANIEIGPFSAILLDTAGIHKHRSQLEQKGIKKTLSTIKDSDLVIFLTHARTRVLDIDESEIIANLKKWKKDFIHCVNKSDLLKNNQQNDRNLVFISAKNKQINPLIDAIIKKLELSTVKHQEKYIIVDKWQLALLKQGIEKLDNFLKILSNESYVDLLIEPLKETNDILLKILGKLEDYDLMDEIFKNFCLGK